MLQPTGQAMKKRTRAGGDQIKGPRRADPRHRNAPKVPVRANSSTTGKETEIARLTRELSEERNHRYLGIAAHLIPKEVTATIEAGSGVLDLEVHGNPAGH